MKKFLMISILVIGLTLRFYKLGEVPQSLDWDEVSLGYNAYSMLLTGADEYGNSWPLSIRSFNDYKPPAYAYFTIPSVWIFGLTDYAVRFPSAVFGTLTIVFVYLLASEFFARSKLQMSKYVPIISMMVFAISPWSIQFSRAAFEANIGLFFVISGMFALLRFLNTSKPLWIYISALLLAAAMYSYHAPRLIVPLLLLGVLIRYWKFFRANIKHAAIATLLAVFLVAPLIVVTMRGNLSARFSSVSVFKPEIEMLRTLEYANEDKMQGKWEAIFHNRRVIYAQTMIEGYLDHLYPTSMFISGDPVGRHHAPSMGHFYFIELPLFIIGLIYLIKKTFQFKFVFFYWALIGPIPAAISTGTPHAIRSILVNPIPQIIIAVGILATTLWIKQKLQSANISKPSSIIPVIIITSLYLGNLIYYLNQYYVHLDTEYAREWQYGYKELIKTLEPIEDKYDRIIITTAWDQPYIYFLFYKQYDPRTWVNSGSFNRGFDKYEFRRIIWSEDKLLPNTLLVGGPGEIPENEPGTIGVITFPDGNLDAFRLYDDLKY